MKKTNKRGYLVIALIVILLALAVGYAAFTTSLTINGTAATNGTWDVKFTTATMSDATHGTAVVSGDGLTITVSSTLAFPGDGFTCTANIKNNGNIPAKLTAFALTDDQGETFSNTDIEVKVPTIATDGTEVIAAGATCPVTFSVQWKDTSTATSATAKFKISFTYAQDTTAATVAPSHGTHN